MYVPFGEMYEVCSLLPLVVKVLHYMCKSIDTSDQMLLQKEQSKCCQTRSHGKREKCIKLNIVLGIGNNGIHEQSIPCTVTDL